ncbi:MAG: exodeoxyribonuclease VII large subunit [Oscillospiraceae bacterium]|nr:exodeoxyribonuclease VII large subunit [Oscillospiraceae bacterium]
MEQVISVSQVNKYLKLKMDHDVRLSDIYISGEISNFTNHAKSGHFYFSLKDNDSVIKAVMFRQNALNVKFAPKDGQKVIVRGQVSVFERDGIYQIYVAEMKLDGAGDLALEFEQLKEKLKTEGIFDEAHKKPLPKYPEKIGIVTSPTGAAIQDMFNIFGRRYPLCELVLYPALVQGENSAKTIVNGIKYFNNNEKVDVIIIGRGGGSAEELWCFNDEALAREIYASEIPVVSAVGHETDFTISDFAADLRAPTPSAAAELCTPDVNTLLFRISELSQKLNSVVDNKLKNYSEKLISLENRPCLSDVQFYIDNMRSKLNFFLSRPCLSKPEELFERQKTLLKQKVFDVSALSEQIMHKRRLKLVNCASKLDALSPLKVLTRGFSAVTKDSGIVTAQSLREGDEISILFHDGSADACVTSVKERG